MGNGDMEKFSSWYGEYILAIDMGNLKLQLELASNSYQIRAEKSQICTKKNVYQVKK